MVINKHKQYIFFVNSTTTTLSLAGGMGSVVATIQHNTTPVSSIHYTGWYDCGNLVGHYRSRDQHSNSSTINCGPSKIVTSIFIVVKYLAKNF